MSVVWSKKNLTVFTISHSFSLREEVLVSFVFFSPRRRSGNLWFGLGFTEREESGSGHRTMSCELHMCNKSLLRENTLIGQNSADNIVDFLAWCRKVCAPKLFVQNLPPTICIIRI